MSLRICATLLLAVFSLTASEHRGHIAFRGSPVPGATVTVTQRGTKSVAVTDVQGLYSFADLPDGTWTIEISMFGFASVKQDILVAPNAPIARWELTMLPADRISAAVQASTTARIPPASARAPETHNQRPIAERPIPSRDREGVVSQSSDDLMSERAADGFLINGSVNNGAASPFAQAAAFGNNRRGARSLYNGGIGVTLGNSAFDARPFSLTGQNTPRPDYSRTTGFVTLGGPLQIPGLLRNGPNFFVGYQWTRNNNAAAATALMPTPAGRNGLFADPVTDPLTGTPFPGNVIPLSRISPQALSLLSLYPLPNFDSGAGYNYQIPLLNPMHQDALQSRLMKNLGVSDQVYGHFNFQSTRMDNPNVFGFLDTTSIFGINTAAYWSHRLSRQSFLNLGYQFSRLSTRVNPFFANRQNVSGQAGISGNNQDPMNWGPPSLNFSSGIAGLTDAQSSFNRGQTSGLTGSMLWNWGSHNITAGGGIRRQAFNYLSQQDPRGTFAFTGAATGSDFAGFLLGIPDTASIAFGNADKYFRQSVYDAYFTDDWRVSPALTLNAGVRWEYGAPITELYGRLVNLDIAPGFNSVSPVVASDPTGAITGLLYPNSLIQPYTGGLAPRVGIAWRPSSGSSLVIRGGYGIYYDTSVYQALALRMAQQPPLSKTFGIQNSTANPVTLANAFTAAVSNAGNTFAVDPNFRPGYAQNWQLSIQRDLPGSLQMAATYLGIKGTHAMQAFLPNTFPAGAAKPCVACPTGFTYLVSGGNSSRQAAQFQLRRRLRSGFTATLLYTFSKSIDNAAALGGQRTAASSHGPAGQEGGAGRASAGSGTGMGGLAIAQNWLDLTAERGVSSFDQRHLLSLQMQYTTGMGLGGGTLLNGWKGALFKEWTVAAQITGGTGLPQTPVYLAPVQGTGVTGTIRPDYTGRPLYETAAGLHLNPSAYVAPRPGQWGNAGRNSITGPSQFLVNASLGRVFRLTDRFNLDLRVDAVNALNRVNFTAWNTTVNSPQFGLPASANAMRTVQTTLRLRF